MGLVGAWDEAASKVTAKAFRAGSSVLTGVHPFGRSAPRGSGDRGAGPASVHESRIISELGIANRTEAAAYAH